MASSSQKARKIRFAALIAPALALLLAGTSTIAEPVVTDVQVFTFHSPTDHEIRAIVTIDTSASTAPVDRVTFVDPAGTEFAMTENGEGSYYLGQSYGLSPPPLGTATVTVVDEQGSDFVTTRELSNVVEEIPSLSFPTADSTFDDSRPLFDWDDVSDERPINYGLFLGRRSEGDLAVWILNGHPVSQARFDFDGTATESLILGETYILEITAVDPEGNASIDSVVFTFAETVPPIFLESEALRIELDGKRPRVVEYGWKATGARLFGDPTPRTYVTAYTGGGEDFLLPVTVSVRHDNNTACYRLRVFTGTATVGELDLCYRLSGDTLRVALENVSEEPGQRLLALHTPALVSVRASQPGAKLVVAAREGRLVDVATALPGSGETVSLRKSSWSCPLLAGALYHEGLNATVSFDHGDVDLVSRIDQLPDGERSGVIAATLPYRFAPESGNAAFIDVRGDASRPVAVDITLFSDYDGDGDSDWIDSAKLLRDRIATTPDPRYTDSFIFKMGREGATRVSDHLANLEKIHHLIDGIPMHVYMLDVTPWPFSSVFGVAGEISEDFATPAELLSAFRVAETDFGAFLSFHDNYTDLFAGSPGYDPSWRVLRADGEVISHQTDIPGFETAFVANMPVYAATGAPERISRTLERYLVKKSYHLDVLSVIFERDYSPDHPTSAEESRRGIEDIVKIFDASGVDVTSETLSVPLIDSGIGWFLDTPRIFSQLLSFGNEQVIPLVEFVAHGKTLYGLFWDIYPPGQLSPEEVTTYAVLDPLLLGANSAAHVTWNTASSPIDLDRTGLEIPSFYLIDLPWMALNRRLMTDYEVDGSYHKISYGEGTFVEVDYAADTYEIRVDSRVIAKDYTTIYPKSDDTFLLYSRDTRRLGVELPPEWSTAAGTLLLRPLTESGPGPPLAFDLDGAHLSFEAEGGVPYKLVGAAPCAASESNLCLNQGRFRVEVEWRDFENRTGSASVVPFGSDDSGLFWFFDPDNWEMLVKVLDGCGINDRIWVFSSATTNVEYTLRVTDSETNTVKEYFNPLGNAAAAITDTEAFATCPPPSS